jgi:hypothetical protein
MGVAMKLTHEHHGYEPVVAFLLSKWYSIAAAIMLSFVNVYVGAAMIGVGSPAVALRIYRKRAGYYANQQRS